MQLQDYFAARLLDAKIFDLAHRYLTPTGWIQSVGGEPQDSAGPLPWFTYGTITILKRMVEPQAKVFEFGAGNSTLWWSQHAAQVVSVEHSTEWVEKIRPRLPSHATLIHSPMNAPVDPSFQPLLAEFFAVPRDLPQSDNQFHNMTHGLMCQEFAAYASELLRFPVGHFDVIVVDGMARVLTAWLAARQIHPDGIIVFDNADRWQYNAAYDLLIDAGFARIDFWGLGPVQTNGWCTSIFTKSLAPFTRAATISRDGTSDLGW